MGKKSDPLIQAITQLKQNSEALKNSSESGATQERIKESITSARECLEKLKSWEEEHHQPVLCTSYLPFVATKELQESVFKFYLQSHPRAIRWLYRLLKTERNVSRLAPSPLLDPLCSVHTRESLNT